MIMIMVIIATWKAHMGGAGDYEGPSQDFELEIDTWLGCSILTQNFHILTIYELYLGINWAEIHFRVFLWEWSLLNGSYGVCCGDASQAFVHGDLTVLGLSVLIKHYCITAACELYFSINGEETKISSGFYGNKASWKVHVAGGVWSSRLEVRSW